ncbi:hypothetical protein D9M72_560750 [compost metagenome]
MFRDNHIGTAVFQLHVKLGAKRGYLTIGGSDREWPLWIWRDDEIGFTAKQLNLTLAVRYIESDCRACIELDGRAILKFDGRHFVAGRHGICAQPHRAVVSDKTTCESTK